jgi:hypothetical protein
MIGEKQGEKLYYIIAGSAVTGQKVTNNLLNPQTVRADNRASGESAV